MLGWCVVVGPPESSHWPLATNLAPILEVRKCGSAKNWPENPCNPLPPVRPAVAGCSPMMNVLPVQLPHRHHQLPLELPTPGGTLGGWTRDVVSLRHPRGPPEAAPDCCRRHPPPHRMVCEGVRTRSTRGGARRGTWSSRHHVIPGQGRGWGTMAFSPNSGLSLTLGLFCELSADVWWNFRHKLKKHEQFWLFHSRNLRAHIGSVVWGRDAPPPLPPSL